MSCWRVNKIKNFDEYWAMVAEPANPDSIIRLCVSHKTIEFTNSPNHKKMHTHTVLDAIKTIESVESTVLVAI